MNARRKGLLTAGVILAVGALTGMGTMSAFSATTRNEANTITAGSVSITDNDAAAPLYVESNAAPALVITKCIEVTYTGSLDSTVELYLEDTVTPLGTYVDLVIEDGTQAAPVFPDCTGFTADQTLFTGELETFQTTHNSNANGLNTPQAAAADWVQNDTRVYRFTLTIQDNTLAQGLTTGLHDFVWESTNV